MRGQEITQESQQIFTGKLSHNDSISPPVGLLNFHIIKKHKTILIIPLVFLILLISLHDQFLQLTNFHVAFTYPVPTVGIPNSGASFNFTKIKDIQLFEFESLLINSLQPFNSSSCQLASIGGTLICKNLIKKSVALLNLGHKRQDSFGCQLQTDHNIFNFFYGCGSDHFPLCSPNTFSSYNCLGQVSQNHFFKKYQSLSDIIHEHKLQNQHLILKMDMKRDEWASLRSLPLEYLDYFDQVVLQINLNEFLYWGNIDIVKSLLSKFYPINLHMNNLHCRSNEAILSNESKIQASVFEVTLVNSRVIKINNNTRSFRLHPSNKKTFIQLQDCQMPHEPFQLDNKPIKILQIPQSQKSLHQLQNQHIHFRSVYNYPTLGTLLTQKVFNFDKIAQDDRPQYHQHIADLFKPFNDTNCHYARYGDPNDQGYLLCQNLLPNSSALINLGISGSDSFGCSLTSEFDQPNLQYDCTDTRAPYCRANGHANTFTPACLAQRSEHLASENRTYYSLRDIIDSHGLEGRHITVKIDVEGGEWSGLRSLPVQYLDYIDQLVVEFHLEEKFGYFQGNYQILKNLRWKFYPVNFHQNNNNCWKKYKGSLRSTVFEVTLVNKKILTLHSRSRSHKSHPLNTPNTLKREDCQINPYQ